ncbi:MAG: DUF456 family protein [Verrucomicrobiota bacterium]
MSGLITFLQGIVSGVGYVAVAMMCLVALLLSCLSISGTWLVLAAALLAAIVGGAGFPGLGTILLFIYIAVFVEVAEYVASVWGVRKRGGSGWAGVAALAGGVLGLYLGSVIPVPVFGNLLGMMLGSFGLVYAVERMRLKKSEPAVHIAWGAVMARVAVALIKVAATLGMIAWLWIGIAARK